MRAVVQRVQRASVSVDGEQVGAIDHGLLVLVGVGVGDGEGEAAWLAEKIATLRIFADGEGRMERSVQGVGGGVLVVSQFTLYGDARKGRRPSYTGSAPPEVAEPLVEQVVELLRAKDLSVATGRFRAMMQVESINDGPVTILLDSSKAF